MILYDENYNFLGISSDTLTFLGYEDMTEFLALVPDFVNLLVKKDGYVHEFNNFSWIDFILFSGASNKKALIKLKNNKTIETNIDAKEIFLVDENKRYYMVEIDKNFINLESQDDSDGQNSSFENFKLNESILGVEVKNSVQDSSSFAKEQESEYSLSFESQNSSSIKDNEESFILDISDTTKSDHQKVDTAEELTTNSSGEFRLNLDLDLSTIKKESKSIKQENINTPFVDQNSFNKEDRLKHDQEFNTDKNSFNNLDTNLEQDVPKIDETVDKKLQNNKSSFVDIDKLEALKNQKSKKDFKPNSLLAKLLKPQINKDKKKSKDEQKELSKELNLDDHVECNDKSDNLNLFKKEKEKDGGLNFLKIDIDKDEQKELAKELNLDDHVECNDKNDNLNLFKKEKELNLDDGLIPNLLKLDDEEIKKDDKEDIIGQIKSDIQEIDGVNSSDKSVQIKDSLNSKIEKDKDGDNNQGTLFQSRLKDLFKQNSEKKEQDQPKSSLFKLKSLDSSGIKNEKDSKKSHQESSLKEILNSYNGFVDNSVNQQKEQSGGDEDEFSLSFLGLSREEEYSLVNDFVNESKGYIRMIDEFCENSDYENILYTLIKIYSSAEILSIKSIIDITHNMKKACEGKDIDAIVTLNRKLESKIVALEEHFKQL